MRPALAPLLLVFTFSGSALGITGKAPPATGDLARAIVMLTDSDGDLCTGTALSRDVVLTAAHCLIGQRKRSVKVYQTGEVIPVGKIAQHPRFDAKAYAMSRATADVALVKLDKPLPDIVAPAEIAPARRVAVGETLTIAGFGVTAAFTPYGLGVPREAALTVTGQPGSLQIRLIDPVTRNERAGLGACTGDSGAPAYDAEGRIVGVVSWSTAPNNEQGCAGLTGLTPLFAYRDWIEQEKVKVGSIRGKAQNSR